MFLIHESKYDNMTLNLLVGFRFFLYIYNALFVPYKGLINKGLHNFHIVMVGIIIPTIECLNCT
jgi:hypothetical protein